jgi:hypothetical protein
LIGYLRFFVPLKNFSLIWRRHHCRWRAAKFRAMLGLWAGRDLYRATPAVTQDLWFSGLIRGIDPFSRRLRITRECGGSFHGAFRPRRCILTYGGISGDNLVLFSARCWFRISFIRYMYVHSLTLDYDNALSSEDCQLSCNLFRLPLSNVLYTTIWCPQCYLRTKLHCLRCTSTTWYISVYNFIYIDFYIVFWVCWLYDVLELKIQYSVIFSPWSNYPTNNIIHTWSLFIRFLSIILRLSYIETSLNVAEIPNVCNVQKYAATLGLPFLMSQSIINTFDYISSLHHFDASHLAENHFPPHLFYHGMQRT